MGFKSLLTTIANGPFNYRAGPDTLGVGVDNLALVDPGMPHNSDYLSPRYNTRRSFDLGFVTEPNMGQKLPDTSLRANGVYLSGTLELQSLIEDYNKGQSNG